MEINNFLTLGNVEEKFVNKLKVCKSHGHGLACHTSPHVITDKLRSTLFDKLFIENETKKKQKTIKQKDDTYL